MAMFPGSCLKSFLKVYFIWLIVFLDPGIHGQKPVGPGPNKFWKSWINSGLMKVLWRSVNPCLIHKIIIHFGHVCSFLKVNSIFQIWGVEIKIWIDLSFAYYCRVRLFPDNGLEYGLAGYNWKIGMSIEEIEWFRDYMERRLMEDGPHVGLPSYFIAYRRFGDFWFGEMGLRVNWDACSRLYLCLYWPVRNMNKWSSGRHTPPYKLWLLSFICPDLSR